MVYLNKYNNIMENKGITISIPIFLTSMFIGLQIFGIINWPWYFILAPILISAGLGIIITILVLFILIILLALKLKNE